MWHCEQGPSLFDSTDEDDDDVLFYFIFLNVPFEQAYWLIIEHNKVRMN